jgi:hypothetical protein
MITLKKEVNGKTFKTEFDFDNKHIGLVRDVLKCLEGKTFHVPDPTSKERAMIQIPILDWLPIVCKNVSFDNTYGHYFKGCNLAFHVVNMWECRNTILDGFHCLSESQVDKNYIERIKKFANLDGSHRKITIARELKKSDDAFRFVLAHEIQHAKKQLLKDCGFTTLDILSPLDLFLTE